MRVAVIGAGVVGVTTAYELALDGHDVTVFERRGTVAAETSFANAGIVSPGYVTPWAAPGMPGKVMSQLFGAHAAVRFGGAPDFALLGWLARWRRACAPGLYAANRARMQRLARYSQQRLHALTADLRLDYDRRLGHLVLLRAPQDVPLVRAGLKLLAESGLDFHLVDGARCRMLEPGLNADMPLHAGIHLPNDEVGNCRQFTHGLKGEAVRVGVRFRFREEVLAMEPGTPVQVRHRAAEVQEPPPEITTSTFDAVVVCAALGARALLAPRGLKLPLVPVWGYSLTAPLRLIEGHPEIGPQSALMDERYKVAITRLGSRVRVAGGAELGGSAARQHPKLIATLYKVLHDWFPGAAHLAQAQRWKGARPMLPDGPPVLGSSGLPGVWLNLGHGSSGWALACGSARVVADAMAGRAPAIDTEGLGIERLR